MISYFMKVVLFSDNVLFQAFMSGSGTMTVGAENMLSFGSSSVNVGEGFDAESSVFVCPVTGM